MRILMCATSKYDPSSRFRLIQFAPHLYKVGHQVDILTPTPRYHWKNPYTKIRTVFWAGTYAASIIRMLSRLPVILKAGNYDVIMINRPLIPELWAHFMEPWLKRRNPRIIFDFDDAIHLGNNKEKVSKIISLSSWVTPGNPYLAEFAKQHNKNVTVIPTVINTEHYQPATTRQPGPIRIGWSGSYGSIGQALPLLKPILEQLSLEEEFEFVVISNTRSALLDDWKNTRIKFIPWTQQTEVEGLQQIDIGLMPLSDRTFEKGKCGLKAIQYMGVGIQAVASPVGVNKDIVLDGKTGFLVKTPEEWKSSLRQLLHNQELREEMGAAARERVENHYSIKAVLPTMVNIFEKVMDLHP